MLLLGACLALSAAGTLALAVVAVTIPREQDYGEPIVYSHAARLVRGEPLYQPVDRPPFTVAAYTPLYYAVAGAARAVFGPGFGPGRVVSLGSACVAASLVGALAARPTRAPWAGGLAAAMFLGLGFPGALPWFALYRVDMLGVALGLAAVAVLAGGTSRRRLLLAGLLAALAILTKQTLVAAALAGALWLAARRWRQSALFAGTTAAVVGLAGALLQGTTGGAFLANTVWANVNPFNREAAVGLAGTLAVSQAGPLLWAGFYLLSARPWRSRPTQLLLAYWVASAVPLLGLGKVGANTNYWIELAAATSILAALGVQHAVLSNGRGFWAVVPPSLLCLATAMAGIPVASGRVSALWQSQGVSAAELDPGAAAFGQLVSRVRGEPKDVLGLPMDVVVLADRPIILEPMLYSLFQSAGTWSPRPLVERICDGQIGLLVVRVPIDATARFEGYDVWPTSVMAALRRTMTLDRVQAGYYVYVQRPPGSTAPARSLCGSRDPQA